MLGPWKLLFLMVVGGAIWLGIYYLVGALIGLLASYGVV